LATDLQQSPFLNILPDRKTRDTLKLMGRSTDDRVTADVAQDICLRTQSAAVITGSISSLGSQYVIGLNAVNCQTGESLARETTQAAKKEDVLNALDHAATHLREKVGESVSSIQKYDTPLSQATTPSLEALKAYSLGEKAYREKGNAAALPHHQRAIQLDPNFAMGYSAVGSDYYSLAEPGRVNEYFAKAFELRDHASELEKLALAANYYFTVTGELDKAAQTYREEIESYPRSSRVHGNLGNVYTSQGQYEKAADAYREQLRHAPDDVSPYEGLGNSLLALQRFEEARQTIHCAQARKLDDYLLHNAFYALAFLGADSSAMAEQQQWFTGKPEENFGLSLASDTEAYAGHLGKARELTRRSVDSAIRATAVSCGAAGRGR
jgi:tetratricopeptide (TPR) repeat protein